MQVLLLAQVLKDLGLLSCHGCVKPLEEVGNKNFVIKYAPGITLGGARHPGKVPNAKGPVLADVKGPGINFSQFRVGVTNMMSTFCAFSHKVFMLRPFQTHIWICHKQGFPMSPNSGWKEDF